MGLAWFDYPSADNVAHLFDIKECSGMGICDRTVGLCTCMLNFQGSACEQMSCPGSLATSICNGNGQCVDMATLATFATVEGNLASYTYGVVPNNPQTWDAHKVLGCYCDPGYTGHDCSLKSCPYGADPEQPNPRQTVQTITCTDNNNGGVVVFQFQQFSTLALSSTITSAQLQVALEGLSTVGYVTVVPVDGSPDNLCSIGGSHFAITFMQDHGTLPLLQITPTNVDFINIVMTDPGNTLNLECSGRGICNRASGVCNCLTGYGSSNGRGGAGNSGDCSFILPTSL